MIFTNVFAFEQRDSAELSARSKSHGLDLTRKFACPVAVRHGTGAINLLGFLCSGSGDCRS